MINDRVHEQIVKNLPQVYEWFRVKRAGHSYPFYSSVDIRDSSYKVVSVDANIFPAGFNNICPTDKENMPPIFKSYFDAHYGEDYRKILLLTEEHTNNLFYWDNVSTLLQTFTESGREVRVAVPRVFSGSTEITSASGAKIRVFSAKRKGGGVELEDGFVPQLIISNNDFSDSYEEWSEGLTTPMNPPRGLGWFQRKKSDHFEFYNQLAGEFAKVIDVDPWTFQVKTVRLTDFDITDDASLEVLAQKVDVMLSELRKEYSARRISKEPFVFVKNNSGTYGMGVTSVHSSNEIRQWNSKSRKKMKVSKGSRTVSEIIIQEGVPSVIQAGSDTAEPTIYIVGCDLIGGFLRAHSEKGPDDSLNSPGAVYRRLCVTDLKVSVEGSPMENVYGWVARLSSLAIGLEAERLKIEFAAYKPAPCS